MKMQGPKQKQGQNVGTKSAFTPKKDKVDYLNYQLKKTCQRNLNIKT